MSRREDLTDITREREIERTRVSDVSRRFVHDGGAVIG
jgi:hypothetical protein